MDIESAKASEAKKLSRFCGRKEAEVPNGWFRHANRVLLAAEDPIAAAYGSPSSSNRWHMTIDGFGRRTEDKKYSFTVIQVGRYWYVLRRQTGCSKIYLEVLAVAFGRAPICAKTAEDARKLADHCYPSSGLKLPVIWIPWLDKNIVPLV
ncbi:hypothetical protein AB8Z38_29470 [Bradyrhizobium sp. LLZ17]|uniref:Uncharacterized protein n=1 Tax=Bradyrhizobium sp. LLZ17 TaxID=3239388 RepID=A0AB39XFG1_9BRAD